LAVLVEEVGEIAQAVKYVNGLKPRLAWSEQRVRTSLGDELIQVAAIATDWLLCPDVISTRCSDN
jgi:NTP pyrophosphatase (non-canonical NTP hydrolase)